MAKGYIALAYMTGILPIKKYGTHSALNMFMEYSMTDPGNMAEYFGFTEKEVENLCIEYGISIEETKAWYNEMCIRDRCPVYLYGKNTWLQQWGNQQTLHPVNITRCRAVPALKLSS